MSAALALVNNITQPVIEEAAVERAVIAMKEIIPDAEGFVLFEPDATESGGIPAGVAEIYGTTNNTGYIFMVTSYGYGGEIKLICGIDPDGKIIKTKILAHNETRGLGTKVFDIFGKELDESEEKTISFVKNTDAVAGATITSNAYKNGILDAFAAFEIITKGEEPYE